MEETSVHPPRQLSLRDKPSRQQRQWYRKACGSLDHFRASWQKLVATSTGRNPTSRSYAEHMDVKIVELFRIE